MALHAAGVPLAQNGSRSETNGAGPAGGEDSRLPALTRLCSTPAAGDLAKEQLRIFHGALYSLPWWSKCALFFPEVERNPIRRGPKRSVGKSKLRAREPWKLLSISVAVGLFPLMCCKFALLSACTLSNPQAQEL